jgi:uncharacterized protein YjiS (DUF1127 family)
MKSNFFKKLTNMLSEYKSKRVSRVQYNETFRELSRLSDKELLDIGLARGNIRSVALEIYQK